MDLHVEGFGKQKSTNQILYFSKFSDINPHTTYPTVTHDLINCWLIQARVGAER